MFRKRNLSLTIVRKTLEEEKSRIIKFNLITLFERLKYGNKVGYVVYVKFSTKVDNEDEVLEIKSAKSLNPNNTLS